MESTATEPRHRGFTAETRPTNGGRKSGYLAQRQLCEDIIGKQGTKEYDQFVKSTRASILAGTCPSALTTLLLHYGYGKPVDRIEVKEVKNEMEDLNEDQLRERARRLAVAAFAPPTPQEDSDSTIQ